MLKKAFEKIKKIGKFEKNDLWLIPCTIVAFIILFFFLSHEKEVHKMVVMGPCVTCLTLLSNGFFFVFAFICLFQSRDDKEARKEIFEAIKTFFIALGAIIGLPNALSHLNQNFFIINTSFVFAAFLPMILGAYVKIIYFSGKKNISK